MKIAVTGSIASDHLMHFPGRFADQFIEEKLDKVSLSFLVDELVVRRGGIATNICYGLAQLGQNPLLVGAVGKDFFDGYAGWLTDNGVDTDSVYVSPTSHTARFICTTDEELCQIGSFYAGAMNESEKIDLVPVHERAGGLEMMLISASNPAAMLKHARQCRELDIPFAADPSQQLARMDGDMVTEMIQGARFLLGNEYEKELLESKTGLSDAEVLDRVQVRVTTLGKDGVEITGRGMDPIRVPAAREVVPKDPTGVGDGFRAGFFAALGWGLSPRRAAEVGNVLAAVVLETDGPQEYEVDRAVFARRMGESFGPAAEADVAPHLNV